MIDNHPRNGTTTAISQTFSYQDDEIVRDVRVGRYTSQSRMTFDQQVKCTHSSGTLGKDWATRRLRGHIPRIALSVPETPLTVVDFCCGSGGFATGFRWACQATGLRCKVVAAVDVSPQPLSVYKLNLHPLRLISEHMANLVDYSSEERGRFRRPKVSPTLREVVRKDIDVVLAGPPCEGNSNFNNRTRRVDKRNEMYVACVAAAIGLGARVIIIENVVPVTNARQRVVPRAIRLLKKSGYHAVVEFILDASDFGTAQHRRRHFLIAARKQDTGIPECVDGLRIDKMSTLDAIGDIADGSRLGVLDRTSKLSAENEDRINYLFQNSTDYDLPDSQRPYCHREKDHTYPSIYGRMFPDRPSQTITTGFLSPGRGRFVHPTRPRGLTVREGARLQGFPDDYRWYRKEENISRNALAHLIGDAVPPPLGYVAGLLGIAAL